MSDWLYVVLLVFCGSLPGTIFGRIIGDYLGRRWFSDCYDKQGRLRCKESRKNLVCC